MTQPILSISRRTRSTPFSTRVNAAGVGGYTVYNHMLLPTFFGDMVKNYHHLKHHVQIWDVSCERQVEIKGKDAAELVQKLVPRDLQTMRIGQCYYVPLVDENGGLLNDPMIIKIADNHYWISVADADVLLWVKGLALGFKMAVSVEEPDISPLAVQGPKANILMARLFGEDVLKTKFFSLSQVTFQGREMFVSRSGYSKQGGFEIYLNDRNLGTALWDKLFEAGQDLNVAPGCPNLIERIEGGLLSYGNDMTRVNNPFECNFDDFCDDEVMNYCIGGAKLLEHQQNVTQRIRGLYIEATNLPPCRIPWQLFSTDKSEGKPVGQMTSVAFSPDFGCYLGIAMVASAHWQSDNFIRVKTPAGDEYAAKVCQLPFEK